MKQKLVVNSSGVILAVLPIDHKWGKRDLESGRYEKLVDDTVENIEHMRKRRMVIGSAGKFILLPEAEWPETIQAKEEQLAEIESALLGGE